MWKRWHLVFLKQNWRWSVSSLCFMFRFASSCISCSGFISLILLFWAFKWAFLSFFVRNSGYFQVLIEIKLLLLNLAASFLSVVPPGSFPGIVIGEVSKLIIYLYVSGCSESDICQLFLSLARPGFNVLLYFSRFLWIEGWNGGKLKL